ncbi:hypothetical protein EMO89_01660 [Bifidobacterium tissieri]|uniref:Phage protein Gp19/Gp15/Gp42 n=1 Tax=Bifidobacterium tissieri TaxID=1630162 RepID=A0A5M9ZUY3_9BIFI|nr:Gp19/Gp15/Gp42 family protein [Bifidobacterium tissieri]KAA8831467.1 hypothetical protein EMO89_01660 [Bifidobacterium tissieri]
MANDIDPGMQVVSPPFATVTDLENRWHTLTGPERVRAGVLLEDASDKIMTDCPHWTEASEATLRRITCAMVKRAMSSPDYAGADLTGLNQTVGSVSVGLTYANPSGDLYLTKAEKRSLGEGVQRMWSIDMSTGEASL